MKLNYLTKLSAIFSLVVSTLAGPTGDFRLGTRATKLTHRAETGVSEVAGTWVAWQPGYLS